MKREIFVFMGPPGSGKGSLSSICVQQLGYIQISTGNLCRKHIAEQTKIGQEIDFALKAGKLIPDSLIVEMVRDWITGQTETSCPLILDGFPRTVNQALELDKMIREISLFDLKIVRFAVPNEIIVDRLGMRYVCNNKECQMVYSLNPKSGLSPKKVMVCDACSCALIRRQDDAEETVRERLNMYYQHEKDLLDFYSTAGYVINEFNAQKPLEEVFGDFKRLFNLKHS